MDNHRILVLSGQLWCGLCYEAKRERRQIAGHGRKHGRASKDKKWMLLKKPSANGSSGGSSSKPICHGTILSAFPALLEFLTLSTWEDGSPRKPGTLLIFLDGGTWKACLKDKNGPRVCFVSCPDLDGLLLAVEQGLIDDSLDWRPDRKASGPAR